jgi:cytochrome c-type biogenesis protein CcmH
MTQIEDLKRQIAQLDELMRTGVLTKKAARAKRDSLEAELLACVTGSAKSGVAVQGTAPSWRLLSGVTVFALAFAAAGYAWLGNREGLNVAPGSTVAAAADSSQGAGAGHAMGAAQIEGLIEKLKERLKATPDDVEGWTMLGRSYSVLGRHAEALPAYRKVIELNPKNAQAYADLADAVGTANGSKLDGEPEKLIAQALSLDPNNVKALALSGTVAFNRGDAAKAAKLWEQALHGLEPGSDMAQQLQGALAEARQRAGLPPLAAPMAPMQAATAETAPAAKTVAGGASIQGRVSLSAKLKGQVSPEDTVFIFARPVSGGRAPLAILRKQVKDLPLDFTLDESLAMSPTMSLATVGEAQVGARVSKSGNAMPQAGDLQGIAAAVKVGSKGLAIEINEVVK